MVAFLIPAKDAKASSHAERGRLGARKRWGDTPRLVRLDELSPSQRRLVLALIDAAKTERDADERAA